MTDEQPVTYFVALPFTTAPDGPAPGQAEQCQSSSAAVRTAQVVCTENLTPDILVMESTEDST